MAPNQRTSTQRQLLVLHRELDQCVACPNMIGPVVHGGAVASKVLLIGQAPGPHEGKLAKPFAWTAGKTLFRWFGDAFHVSEEQFRQSVYMAAVARCFPGKAKGGGDRKPDPTEISRCERFLVREVEILDPELVLPVGSLAIERVLGHRGPLAEVVGSLRQATFHGKPVEVLALPHPSGASTWHRTEPGKTLLAKALKVLAKHPTWRRTLL